MTTNFQEKSYWFYVHSKCINILLCKRNNYFIVFFVFIGVNSYSELALILTVFDSKFKQNIYYREWTFKISAHV